MISSPLMQEITEVQNEAEPTFVAPAAMKSSGRITTPVIAIPLYAVAAMTGTIPAVNNAAAFSRMMTHTTLKERLLYVNDPVEQVIRCN